MAKCYELIEPGGQVVNLGEMGFSFFLEEEEEEEEDYLT